MRYRNISFWRLLVLVALLGYLSGQMLHETGHWAVLKVFGRRPVMSFTGLVQQNEPPADPEGWVEFTAPDGEQVWFHLTSLPGSSAEWVAMLAAGPLANLVAMLAGLLLAYFAKRELLRSLGLLLALINSFGPMLYQIQHTFSGAGGDEYFLASTLGVPKYAITVPLALAAAAGFAVVIKKINGWRVRLKWLTALLIGFVAQGPLLMYADKITQTQVRLKNPFFQPILGFSLPVVIVAGIALLIFLIVLFRWEKALSSGP